MNNRKRVMITIVLVIVLVSILFLTEQRTQKVEEIEHNDLSIQELIDYASPGDTIQINNGVHYENIAIDKPIKIIGEDKKNTIIDGKNTETVIVIQSDNVELSNLTIRNSGGYKDDSGIRIESNYNQIYNCEIYRTKTGLNVISSKANTIDKCLFHTNAEGIFSSNSEGNTIKNCHFTHNSFAINMKDSKSEIVEDSYIYTNGIGIYARNCRDIRIIESAICDNNQDGGGIWCFDCENLNVNNCNINHNGLAIKLKSSDSKISNSTLDYNMYNTIKLENVEKTFIEKCNIQNSYRTAIFISNSKCDIYNNNILNSGLNALDVDKESFIKANNNYWESKYGTSYFAFGPGEKITFRPFRVKILHYKKSPIEDIGCNWDVERRFSKLKIERDFVKNITFLQKDSDTDGAPDFWEEKWGYDPFNAENHNYLDPDEDGLTNIEECYTDEYGSNPFYKDVFIEVDYSEGNKPSDEFIDNAKEIFKEHKITLHIDIGDLDGGEEIPIKNVESCEEFRDIYWDYFLHNDMDNPRKGIFRYAIIADTIDEIWAGFVFVGWDQLDTIGLAIQPIEKKRILKDKSQLIIGGITHELGHLMGLIIDDHDGIDNIRASTPLTFEWLKYKDYKSCLNYRYVYDLIGYSDGSHGKDDFNDWENLDFGFFKDTDFNQKE